MNTPPKSTCHSCNGTGIDPTVGFLDCEFCTPSPTGVSLSAPEQPGPQCATCNDHGEIGCLRQDGYDSERCPDCNPATVKRYHVTETGLVEGQALGRINVVLGADHDRVTAERDALQLSLTMADEKNDTLSVAYLRSGEREHELRVRAHQLEGLLSRWADLLGVSAPGLRDETLAALKPAETQQCQFPQSCPSNCECDIPDFTPGNGNKAKRRAAAIEAMKPESQRVTPVDPFTTCLECFGTGTICTGILEASSTICNGCNGTGREQP